MGSIIKIGEDYYIEFFARGLAYRRNGGKSEKGAQKLLKEIEEKIEQGELTIVTPQISIKQFLDEYLDSIRSTQGAKSYARYESAMNHFREYCRKTLADQAQLPEITPRLIEGYRAHLLKGKVRSKIINFTILLLRNMLDHAINCGFLNDNPALHAQMILSAQNVLPRTLIPKQWDHAMSGASPKLSQALVGLRKTGMRVDELIGLKWANVDFEANCLKIEREIPIDGELLAIVKELNRTKSKDQEFVFTDENQNPWTQTALMREVNPIARALEIKEAAFFGIVRNSFVRDVLERGVPLFDLRALLGFNDIARVMRYAGLVRQS